MAQGVLQVLFNVSACASLCVSFKDGRTSGQTVQIKLDDSASGCQVFSVCFSGCVSVCVSTCSGRVEPEQDRQGAAGGWGGGWGVVRR